MTMTRDEARRAIETVWVGPETVEVLVIVSRGAIEEWAVGDALADAGFGESSEDAADIASSALHDLWMLGLIRSEFSRGPWTLTATEAR